MLTESQKKNLGVAAVIIVVLAGVGLLAYNIKRGSGPEEREFIVAPSPVPEAEIVTVRTENNNLFVFERAGAAIGELLVTPEMKTMTLLRQVGDFAYFKTFPEGGDGYLLFNSSAPQLVRIDSRDGAITTIKKDGRRIEDISPNGQFIAWTEYKENGDKSIVVEDVVAKSEQSFPVEKKYSQFGDAHFSSDSTQLAYAAAIGFPGKENGVVYVINLKDATTKVNASTGQGNTYYRVRGWRDNGDVDSVVQSGDSTDFKMK